MGKLFRICKLFVILILVVISNVIPALAEEPAGNKPERVEWLQDAGFGMLVVLSMDSQIGSVISHSMVGASDDYVNRFIHELPKTFNPKRFDAEELVTLAKLAGIKYIAFNTKHHSGFCMWDTKTTDFNIMNTPYGKDLIAEYVQACRNQGMAVGFYYSPEDFLWLYEHDIMIRRWGLEANPDKNPEYAEYIRKQCRELMTHYGPVNVMFIDGAGYATAREVFWQLQPDLLVTRGALKTPEQTLPGIPLEGAWEACVTMGTQWHYKPTNEIYKSGTRLIELLIETRAKGGALLLNVGPKPNGELPIEQEARLREIALWHMANGESIEKVRPWIVTNEENIWFTKGKDNNTVYAYITKMPDWKRGDRKEFLLKSVKATKETQIDVLGQSSKWVEYQHEVDASCRWEQKEDGFHISVVRAQRLYNNSKWPNPVVIKMTHVMPALVPPQIETKTVSDISSDGKALLIGELIDMGKADLVKVGFQYRPYAGFVEELYDDTWQETVLMEFKKTGEYQIQIEGLEKGATYQARAVVKHPLISIFGEIEKFTVQ